MVALLYLAGITIIASYHTLKKTVSIIMKTMSYKVLLVYITLATSCALVSGATLKAEPSIEQIIETYRLKVSPEPISKKPGWTKPKNIVVSVDTPERLAWYRQVAPDVKLFAVRTLEQAIKATKELNADAVMGFCSDELVKASSNLTWIQVYSAGVDRCVSETLAQSNISLTNGQRLSSPEIAEHAIAMITSLTRGLDQYHQRQLKAEWARDLLPGNDSIWEINGRTLLVVGLGGIGTEIAQRAHGLGMNVIATRNSSKTGPNFVSYVGLADELLTLATKADVVINALPLTDKTQGIFNEQFFKAMPNHAYFISIGRGKSTVTDDLVAALNAGEIAGAGLDVTDPEPLPEDHPLWSMERVLITPHIAWRSDKFFQRLWPVMRENLRRYVNGEPLLSEVDLKKGY